MLVVLAPDKFKGSLTAPEVADALAEGLADSRSGLELRRVPIADGGDGTVAAFVAAGWKSVGVCVPGPDGEPMMVQYARRGSAAVVELAAVCGLALRRGRLDPLGANTIGLGIAIGAALDAGAREIVIGLGGSASTDGGAGMLVGLGASIMDVAGVAVPPGGGALTRAAGVDFAGLHPALAEASLVLACDVDNPLSGPAGAAAVYGPQKGASPEQVSILEAALSNWSKIVEAAVGHDASGLPGAGAAGGTGFAAMAVLGARHRSGVDVVLSAIGFAELSAGADLVITGEGALDAQSLRGKAPSGVLAAARTAGVPVLVVAGRSELTPEQVAAAGFRGCHTLAELEPDPERSMRNAAALLREVGRRIGAELR